MAELSAEEKRKIIEALERDKEFRYSLMGLLGYREVLDRITMLDERLTKLEERFADLEEKFAKLEERFEKGMAETRRLLTAIAHRLGIITEESFREGMRYVVEDVFGVAEVSKWTYYDEEGTVYGHPAAIEADVLIKDREHILLEVKSRVGRGDISELYMIGRLYEKVRGVKPRLAIIGAFIDDRARELARSFGIEIRPIASE